ncbi:uncharacterized protein LOC127855655 [Dreissena polymorpha]|uniref:uncharacterized protein LOC127855655 n=1 Tax=Dreissena polymorpha TaxID=45954 RepID=UPI0022645708|nr:uncharacterized protein LOC127855655 [Dreissena polymorpha]
MEIIKIPRLHTWHEENAVFRSLEKFLELCKRLCRGRHQTGNGAAPVVVLKEILNEKKYPVPELQVLYYSLRDAAFCYRPPESRLETGSHTELFPASVIGRWVKEVTTLKKLCDQYSELVSHFMDVQERCWKSRDKLKLHASMLEAAEMSLPNYVDTAKEYDARKLAIKGLKKDLIDRQARHHKNIVKYQSMLGEEAKLRAHLHEISEQLETEIVTCLCDHVTKAWANLCRATHPLLFQRVLDALELSRGLYCYTTTFFLMNLPPDDVCSSNFNKKVQRARFEKSLFAQHTTGDDEDSGYESCNIRVCINDRPKTIPEYFLKLSPGDFVKLKMFSSDMCVAFGYQKNGRFSFKKWGFIYTDTIMDDSEDAESDPEMDSTTTESTNKLL